MDSILSTIKRERYKVILIHVLGLLTVVSHFLRGFWMEFAKLHIGKCISRLGIRQLDDYFCCWCGFKRSL